MDGSLWQWAEQRAEEVMDIWNARSLSGVEPGPAFTVSEQTAREAAYDRALDEVEIALKQAPASPAARLGLRNRLIAAFGKFSATALGLEEAATALLIDGFLPAGTAFVERARGFDSSLPMPDIIQGCRNAWTACGMQPLLAKPIELSQAIFGYSMLYPYSDNALDRDDLSPRSKLEFSRRFRSRLAGGSHPPRKPTEGCIWKLIALIEEQYPRSHYPEVWQGLLAIHRAQEASIVQTGKPRDGGGRRLLALSCMKGGTSVLADALLAQPRLGESEKCFAFEWGVLLQLGDDLQDIREDLSRRSFTLFSQAAYDGKPLDALALRLLQYSEHVSTRMNSLENGSKVLKDLLRMSWRSLIVRAIADSHQYFSQPLVERLERHSPFRFAFLRERQRKLESHRGLYMLLFDAFAGNPEKALAADAQMLPRCISPAM